MRYLNQVLLSMTNQLFFIDISFDVLSPAFKNIVPVLFFVSKSYKYFKVGNLSSPEIESPANYLSHVACLLI